MGKGDAAFIWIFGMEKMLKESTMKICKEAILKSSIVEICPNERIKIQNLFCLMENSQAIKRNEIFLIAQSPTM